MIIDIVRTSHGTVCSGNTAGDTLNCSACSILQLALAAIGHDADTTHSGDTWTALLTDDTNVLIGSHPAIIPACPNHVRGSLTEWQTRSKDVVFVLSHLP